MRTMSSTEYHSWGPWVLDQSNATLQLMIDGRHRYEINLEKKTSSAAVLDTICQVRAKTFATDDVLAGLVRAFADILRPQAYLCSFGRPSEITNTHLWDLVYRARRPVSSEGFVE